LKKAAVQGSLTDFLDVESIPSSLMSELLATQIAVSSLENLLQTLWFGGDVDYKFNGLTALHFAAKYGTHATVSVLLQANANINVSSMSGRSTLHFAVRYGTLATIRTLLQADAAVNKRDKFGFTSLYTAIKFGEPAAVSILLQANADVNVNTCKESPLSYATRWANHEVILLLLEAKADINFKTHDGYTPILYAAQYRSATIVAELLKFGAKVHEKIDNLDVYKAANNNASDRENVLNVLAKHQGI